MQSAYAGVSVKDRVLHDYEKEGSGSFALPCQCIEIKMIEMTRSDEDKLLASRSIKSCLVLLLFSHAAPLTDNWDYVGLGCLTSY